MPKIPMDADKLAIAKIGAMAQIELLIESFGVSSTLDMFADVCAERSRQLEESGKETEAREYAITSALVQNIADDTEI